MDPLYHPARTSTSPSTTGFIETRRHPLAGFAASPHALSMFLVTEADADAIRAIFHQEGELSAAIELRRRFPGITDNARARAHVRTISGWKPLPLPACSVTRLRPRGTNRGEVHSPIALDETPATDSAK
jgi:hypothetical protein